MQLLKHTLRILHRKTRQIFPPRSHHKGQGVMEYIILSSLIGIFCILAIKQFGGVLLKRIEAMQSKIVKTIEI